MRRFPSLGDVTAAIPGAALKGRPDLEVRGITADSREAGPGCIFAVRKGARFDGASFVPEALERGAIALLAASEMPVAAAQVIVPDVALALGPAAAAAYGDPTSRLRVIGITGTNGKTTTAYLIESAIRAAGGVPAVMGTIQYRYPGVAEAAPLTTAEAYQIQRLARDMVDAGATHLAMEVSSHALDLGRVEGCRFSGAVFTNLSQDHLDYHQDMARYGRAKERLFRDHLHRTPGAWAVVNADDPWGETMAQAAPGPVFRYAVGETQAADFFPTEVTCGRQGIRAVVRTPDGRVEVRSRLWGLHNLSNLLAAFASGFALGLDPDRLAEGVGRVAIVPGRLELVSDAGEIAVLVDYAHTPEAVSTMLHALRPFTPGRVFVVFGCGGDRDRTKRPRMGEAAARGADVAIVSTDNPRTEDPLAIIAEILPGVAASGRPRIEPEEAASSRQGYLVEPDRKAAIRLAVASARPGDTVVIAGKGHEDYQIVGTEKRHFDDREEARAAVEALGPGGA